MVKNEIVPGESTQWFSKPGFNRCVKPAMNLLVVYRRAARSSCREPDYLSPGVLSPTIFANFAKDFRDPDREIFSTVNARGKLFLILR